MAQFQYCTRGMVNPRGKAKVYFCCHPEDVDQYFDTVCGEILTAHDCALWSAGARASAKAS